MLVLFSLVTGIIYTGIATPTEASAIGAFGAFIIAAFRRTLNRATLLHAFRRAAHSSCLLAMILLGASIFGSFFTLPPEIGSAPCRERVCKSCRNRWWPYTKQKNKP